MGRWFRLERTPKTQTLKPRVTLVLTGWERVTQEERVRGVHLRGTMLRGWDGQVCIVSSSPALWSHLTLFEASTLRLVSTGGRVIVTLSNWWRLGRGMFTRLRALSASPHGLIALGLGSRLHHVSVLHIRTRRLREIVACPRFHRETFSIWPEFVAGVHNRRSLCSHHSEGGGWPGSCRKPTGRRV